MLYSATEIHKALAICTYEMFFTMFELKMWTYWLKTLQVLQTEHKPETRTCTHSLLKKIIPRIEPYLPSISYELWF